MTKSGSFQEALSTNCGLVGELPHVLPELESKR